MPDGYLYNLGLRFDAVARRRPDAIALRFPDGAEWSYSRCNDLSSQCARLLLSKGTSQGDVVAIATDKHPMAFVVMLAALKIGAAYVNLDISSPPERLERIVDRARPVLIVHEGATADLIAPLRPRTGAATLDCSGADFEEALQRFEPGLPAETAEVPGNAPAYVMFTSGSTGFPKGAVIPHAAVINFSDWARATVGYDESAVFTNVNPLHFDNSVFDFYAALFQGATMVPFGSDIARQPMKLVKAVEEAGCTIWFSVPSMLIFLMRMRAVTKTSFPALKCFIFGGEGFPKSSLRKLYGLFSDRIAFLNVYGPTECTCICSSYPVSDGDMESDDLLPLGPIAPNFRFLVLDEDGNPVDDGATGELYLRGPNVGLGYLNDPERSAGAFVRVPTVAGYDERCYRTGDLVRYRADTGLLYFAGRADNQVKRMGYRIELEEIEYALGALAGVRENVCVFSRAAGDEVGRIVAYVVGEDLDPDALRTDLGAKIPAYMMPNDFVVVDGLPKNRNGKIDRLAVKDGAVS